MAEATATLGIKRWSIPCPDLGCGMATSPDHPPDAPRPAVPMKDHDSTGSRRVERCGNRTADRERGSGPVRVRRRDRAARQPYEDYVASHIVGALDVAEGDLGFTIDHARHARGYHRGRSISGLALRLLLDTDIHMEPAVGAWRPFRPYYVNGAPYGGIMGTADAFVRYAQALLDPSAGLLSDAARGILFAENILADGRLSGMSKAWHAGELDGYPYRAHAGGGGGYYPELRVYPELGRGSVVLFNRSGMTDRRILDQIDRHLLGGAPRPSP